MGGLVAYVRIRFWLCIMNSVAMTGLSGLFYEGLRGGVTGARTQCDLYVVSGVRVCVAAYDDLCRRPSSMSGREITQSFNSARVL